MLYCIDILNESLKRKTSWWFCCHLVKYAAKVKLNQIESYQGVDFFSTLQCAKSLQYCCGEDHVINVGCTNGKGHLSYDLCKPTLFVLRSFAFMPTPEKASPSDVRAYEITYPKNHWTLL